jgi:hypothetical protein
VAHRPRAAVSRLRCRGDNWETDLTIDVNVDIYPLKARYPRARVRDLHG